MDNIKEKLLFETTDNFKYLTVKEILKDNNIPYFVRDDDSGGYMKIIGEISMYNKRIFVSNLDYEKAFELVEEFIENKEEK